MTRIIGGSAGGRRLKTPSGDSTRPTSDRVREALFSAVEAELGSISGLRFLDLYAGSGAVGIEARSRGAGVVTLVEHDKRTVALIRENVRTLGLSGIEVQASSVVRALTHPPLAPYDLVFVDPPYALDRSALRDALTLLCVNGWLARTGLVIVERGTRDGEPSWPEGIEASRSKKYGETTLWYGHAASPAQRG